MNKVLVISEDPGGANALVPVIRRLAKEERVAAEIYCRGYSKDIFAMQGIEYQEINPILSVSGAIEILKAKNCAGLLTATSMSPNSADKIFIAAARELGIFSISLIDFWSNYRERFRDEAYQLVYLPDKIGIMDEQARADAAEEGIEPSRIHITGQPVFDRLALLRKSFTAVARKKIRQKLDIADDQPFILFASQPTADVCLKRFGDPDHIGYTEYSVIRHLIEAVSALALRTGKEIKVVIRPHPTEDVQQLRKLVDGCSSTLVSGAGDGCEVALAADLVVGMDSEFLVETCYIGLPTISLQPGLRNMKDNLPTNRMGLSRAVYVADEIESVLEKYLFDIGAREKMKKSLSVFQPAGDACKKAVSLLYKGMNI